VVSWTPFTDQLGGGQRDCTCWKSADLAIIAGSRNKEVPDMARTKLSPEQLPFLNVSHARWVIGVLNLLVAVVGRDTLLGLLLRQTRSEIASVIQETASDIATARATHYQNN
jgi:hypothetical protein